MDKIYIHRGDCVVFADITDFLTFMIDSQLDLTNWKAEFHLCSIIKKYDDISSKVIKIILSSEETSLLKCGTWNGALVLIDANGHRKTITNTIPFEVTKEVVENHYQTIDLTIPQSSGVDVTLKVGVDYVTSVNGMTGDVYLEIPSIDGLVTEQQLKSGLNAKQDKGNYALVEQLPTQVSELENDSNFATQTQVLQAIASIPQFKLSIVNELPLAGEKMTLYLVPKEGTNNDVYDEYIWIEQTTSFEHLGTTAVDLTDYVKKTDYATSGVAGVVKVHTNVGTTVNAEGLLHIVGASDSDIAKKSSSTKPITPKTLDLAVKTGVTTNTIELTDDEKVTACNWLGTSKTVSLTEADYNALTTKDANTLYLIEE